MSLVQVYKLVDMVLHSLALVGSRCALPHTDRVGHDVCMHPELLLLIEQRVVCEYYIIRCASSVVTLLSSIYGSAKWMEEKVFEVFCNHQNRYLI